MKKSITPEEEAQFLAALMSHSRKAYSDLYDRYGTSLLGVILRIVQEQEVAEDLLQETFIKIWKNIHRYDPAKGRLFTWLLKIARHTALDYVRFHHQFDPLENAFNLEELITLDINQIGLRETVLAVLEAHHQPIIDLIYFQGYTHQDVANHLELPLGTVKTRVRLAMIELRNRFSTER